MRDQEPSPALRAQMRARGDAIGDPDALIAAIARSRGFAVATRDARYGAVRGVTNPRHFDGVVRNLDGTYTGLVITSAAVTRTPDQAAFDHLVSADNPATGHVDGKVVKVTAVELIRVR